MRLHATSYSYRADAYHGIQSSRTKNSPSVHPTTHLFLSNHPSTFSTKSAFFPLPSKPFSLQNSLSVTTVHLFKLPFFTAVLTSSSASFPPVPRDFFAGLTSSAGEVRLVPRGLSGRERLTRSWVTSSRTEYQSLIALPAYFCSNY